ncbi:hypothetical protein L1049_007124 [Liquidambar formosana]|uniref:Uncharacterized protein n=1 Tax=Liquidambar formosana TaxID=63359 RepID=A0AAP0RGM4_LIQFO
MEILEGPTCFGGGQGIKRKIAWQLTTISTNKEASEREDSSASCCCLLCWFVAYWLGQYGMLLGLGSLCPAVNAPNLQPQPDHDSALSCSAMLSSSALFCLSNTALFQWSPHGFPANGSPCIFYLAFGRQLATAHPSPPTLLPF